MTLRLWKLLVLPMDGSHWLSIQPLVEKLSERRHEVMVVAPEVNWQMRVEQAYTVKTHPVSYILEELEGSLHEDILTHLKALALQKILKTPTKVLLYHWKNLFSNKDMMQYLREGKFEVVLTDPTQLCGPLIAEHLSIPSVYFLRGFPCGMDSDATQCPSPLSYVPRFLLNNSDKMTFTQRVKNVLVRMLEFVYCEPLFARYEELAAEVFLDKMTVVELLSHGSVWLMRYDFVFEFPRPVMPNMVFIGGINCDQKKNLSQVLNFISFFIEKARTEPDLLASISSQLLMRYPSLEELSLQPNSVSEDIAILL
uniref:glucuronosyltransferase n=1 Tax=Amazona collaria TaxID=241587 RepID=A0A8B9FM22_9PSIT